MNKKNPKKAGGRERTFAQNEAFEKEVAASKPYYGKEAQGAKSYNKNKKPPPQYPCPVG